MDSEFIGLVDKVMKISSNRMNLFRESKKPFPLLSTSLKPLQISGNDLMVHIFSLSSFVIFKQLSKLFLEKTVHRSANAPIQKTPQTLCS